MRRCKLTTVKLYLLRHGNADWPNWDKLDDERPLTKKGKRDVRRVAKCLRKLNVNPAVILTSPLPRAFETAEIAAQCLEVRLLEDRALSKGFGIDKLRALLKRTAAEELMIVGHDPGFTDVIRALTGADVKLAKGGVARIDLESCASAGRLVWLLPPKIGNL